MEVWDFWNWDIKEKSAFGDEEAGGRTPFKATKQVTPL